MEDKALIKLGETFDVSIVDIQSMVGEYQKLKLIPDDKDSFGVCRAALTTCIRTRTSIDKRRKELNQDDQDRIKKRNGDAKTLIELIAPAETHLDGLVKGENARIDAIKAEEEARERKKIQGRQAAFLKIGLGYADFELACMTDEEYEAKLAEATEAYEAEQKRKAIEAAEQKAEEARLRIERAEQERKAKELAEKEALIAAEQRRIEAERRAIAEEKRKEQERKDREAFEKKAREEAHIQAEKAAKEKADKEAAEKIEVEKQAKIEAERKAALVPDKEKLIAWVHKPLEMPSPAVKDAEAKGFVRWFEEEIESLVGAAMGKIERL